MEVVTSLDFDGNSDSGIVTGSDSESVSSEATLLGLPTQNVNGNDSNIPSMNMRFEGTAHQTGVAGTTSSGYQTGVAGSTSSGYQTGVAGSTSSGYQTGVAGSTSSGYQTGVAGSTSSGYQTGVVGSTSSGYQTGVVGSTSSGYQTGVVGSTSSGYQTGVAGSTSSGYHTGVVGSNSSGISDQPKLSGLGQMQHGQQVDTASQESGFSSMRTGQNFSLPQQFTEGASRIQKWINSSESTMMEDLTLVDVDGNSNSGIVTSSDSQSVGSGGTLIGSPTPSVHGIEGASSKSLSIGETNQQTSVVRSTSSGSYSGVVGSTSSGYHSGVVGSTTASVIPASVIPASVIPASVIPASEGQKRENVLRDTVSQDSGISSMISERSQSLPLQYTNDGKRTQEWINNSPFDVEVKLLDGRKTTIQVPEDETVTSFKEKVKQKYGIPCKEQRLISGAGRSMADNKLLKDYGIRNAPKIFCQWGQRGG